jgi:hypothetical protein
MRSEFYSLSLPLQYKNTATDRQDLHLRLPLLLIFSICAHNANIVSGMPLIWVSHYSCWQESNPFVTVICYFAKLLQCRAAFEVYDLISPVGCDRAE